MIKIAALWLGVMLGCGATPGVEYSKARFPAHRGESELAPENTMAAYGLAWKNGETIVETDIQLTKDGQVVICHDLDTYRTSGKKTKLVIKDSTLEEIQKVDVGAWKGAQWAGQKCPTLKELYDAMPTGTTCLTEIKSGIDVVPAFVEIVRASGKGPEQIVVISFKEDALEASKKALPAYKHYFLANHKKDKQGNYLPRPNVEEWIATAKRIGADGLDLQAAEPLDQAACEKIQNAGLELHVWTVDDPVVAKKYLDWGAKSVTTNRPSWMRKELAKFDGK
ncbi:MAG TPA: glycerophosphodiester phosphodiesterase [Tepidisphaeraceae bacterium]|jgi:glycerophosphoryl diester phosphodiesterase|nr:glycerophosphodiester phosphodiesterase [Tepidisphaeraceae bacterium]